MIGASLRVVSTFSAARAAGLEGRERLRRVLPWLGPAVYLSVLTVFILRDGVPLSRDRLFMWILLGLLAFSLTNLRGWIRGVVLEWIPFALILWAYDYLRGHADGLLFSTNVTPQLRADEILFGGTAPTVWLQEHLWDGSLHLHWYDYATWVVYVSYFLATYLVAGFLVLRPRPVPPLRRDGVAPRVHGLRDVRPLPGGAAVDGERPGGARADDSLDRLHLEPHSDRVLQHPLRPGLRVLEPVAAVPSLHAAYTLLIALFLWRLAPRWGRVLLAAYPLAMAFALVYTAEHYVSDILVGWAYALFAFWAVNRMADALAARRAARGEPASLIRSLEIRGATRIRLLRDGAPMS